MLVVLNVYSVANPEYEEYGDDGEWFSKKMCNHKRTK